VPLTCGVYDLIIVHKHHHLFWTIVCTTLIGRTNNCPKNCFLSAPLYSARYKTHGALGGVGLDVTASVTSR
jgi:hypothetical protein